jgi:hypothetical protein
VYASEPNADQSFAVRSLKCSFLKRSAGYQKARCTDARAEYVRAAAFPWPGTEIPAANYDATRMPNLDDSAPTRTSVNAAAELVDLDRDRNNRPAHYDQRDENGDWSRLCNDPADVDTLCTREIFGPIFWTKILTKYLI